MSKILTRLAAILAGGVLLAVSAASSPVVNAGNQDAVEKTVIEKIIRDSFCWAFAKDRPRLESILAQDGNLFMFNPDSRSTVVGWDNFIKAFDVWMDPRFESTRFDMRDLRVNVSQSRDVAWYSAIIDDCALWDGVEYCWDDARWTGVLEKRKGKWLIVQMHISLASDRIRADMIKAAKE
jgi:ketosteroid isomerase-like protein